MRARRSTLLASRQLISDSQAILAYSKSDIDTGNHFVMCVEVASVRHASSHFLHFFRLPYWGAAPLVNFLITTFAYQAVTIEHLAFTLPSHCHRYLHQHSPRHQQGSRVAPALIVPYLFTSSARFSSLILFSFLFCHTRHKPDRMTSDTDRRAALKKLKFERAMMAAKKTSPSSVTTDDSDGAAKTVCDFLIAI